MSNYRLDYITKFKPGTVEEMTKIRAKFIEIEEKISQFVEKMTDEYSYNNSENICRTYDQALKHLETAQMYTIKMLCLIGEDNDGT